MERNAQNAGSLEVVGSGVHTGAPLLPGCVALGRWLSLPVPQFPGLVCWGSDGSSNVSGSM